jgi:hypothetical protein
MQYSMDMFGLSKNLYAPENSYTAASTSILDTSTMSWTAIGGYTVAILIVLLIILLFVNYTIYPIFQLEPDGPGFIPVPFMKSNEFFWPPQTTPYVVTDFSSCKVNTAALNYGWSMSLDISIMNPTIPYMVAGQPGFRLLFHRGGTINPVTSQDGGIGSLIIGHNIAIGLLKDTNDLYISVTTHNGEDGILIQNVPTQTPFRVGVVINQNMLEAYLNGKLKTTKQLSSGIDPLSSSSSNLLFQGPLEGTPRQVARVGNLLLWTQSVSPSVMKYATPALMDAVPGLDTLNANNPGSLCSDTSELLSGLTSSVDAATIQNTIGQLFK